MVTRLWCLFCNYRTEHYLTPGQDVAQCLACERWHYIRTGGLT